MNEADVKLLIKIKRLIKGYLDDLDSEFPKFRVQQVPLEIHGHLADALYVDKVKNVAIVTFLIALISAPKDHTDHEVLSLLRQIVVALELITREQPHAEG